VWLCVCVPGAEATGELVQPMLRCGANEVSALTCG